MSQTTRPARRAGILPAALAIGLSLAAASAARAEMISAQPGTVCTAINADRSKVTYSATTGVYNNSTSASAKVHCPILYNVTDFTFTDGLYISAGISTYVNDPNPATGSANDISCQAFGLNSYGTIGFTTAAVTSAGDQSFLNVKYGNGSTGLAFNMVCTLPKKFNNVPFSISRMRVALQD